MAFPRVYCNAQFFERAVRSAPLKCREISKMRVPTAIVCVATF
jgi:hypothetical protein